MLRVSVRACACAVALALLGVPAPATAITTGELERDGLRGIIVVREAGLTAVERADLRADADVRHVRMMRLPDTEVVRAQPGELGEALAQLRADPDVRLAQPDYPVRAAANDPAWSLLWGLENTGQAILGTTGNADADIDAPTAWTASTGSGVTVAVVDTGAQLDHADLATRITGNAGERGAGKETNGIDDDANGKVDDWRGWDFVSNDNTPHDGDGHGTHVSATIAAPADDGTGIAGVAPSATVMPLKALDDTGNGSLSDVADALAYAGASGARVVNASLGSAGDGGVFATAIATYPNTLFVVAAGNDGRNNEATPTYPCNHPQANIVCVGATTSTDLRASFSNYGATSVDLFAPGADIVSAWPTNLHAYLDGTSMASPHVAGAAALVIAANPGWTTAQVKAALLGSVDAKSLLASRSVSGGRLNAARALGLAGDGGSGGGEGPSGSPPPGNGGGVAVVPTPPPPPSPWAPAPDEEADEGDGVPPALALRRRGTTALCRADCPAKTFELRFTLVDPAPVRAVYERHVCRGRRCAWVIVARRIVAGRAGANTLKVGTKVGSKRLGVGRYRLTVAVTSASGRQTGRTTFTVR